MPYALSIAWRLLLSLALVLGPMAGARAAGACCDGMGGMQPQAAPSGTGADAAAMTPCEHMADMAKPAAPAKAPDSPTGPHTGCAASACCVGVIAGLPATALAIGALAPTTLLHIALTEDPSSPPRMRMLRPPIA